jgi:hypothetical protein
MEEDMVNAKTIREHMEVVGSDGQHVGTVDHLEGENRLKLTKSDSADGKHHFVPLDWVESVDSKVHLNKSSRDAMTGWQAA